MAVSRALRRLLLIRDLEEEQRRLALAASVGELDRLEQALADAAQRERRGRRLVGESVYSGQLPDRLAGLEETRAAERRTIALAPRIADAEQDVALLRAEHLAKRIERRQAETLIEEAETEQAVEAERRSQQGLDDWYRNRMHRVQFEAERPSAAAPDQEAARGQT